MLNLPSNKITYIAGILEGEGSFGLMGGKYPSIQLFMSDLDVVQKVRDIMNPSTNIRSREKLNHKTQYIIAIIGQRAVEWMMTLYVLMGARRKEKIRECLQVWRIHTGTRGENISLTKNKNKLVKLIMQARNISREEAEQMFEDSMASVKQTVN